MRKIVKKCFLRRPLFFGSLFLLPGFAIYCLFLYQTPRTPWYNGQKVVLTGTVNAKDIDETGVISALYIHSSYNFKCYLPSEDNADYAVSIGDTVNVTGTVKYFRRATNPGEFDAAKYYETRGYLFSVNADSVVITGKSALPVREYFFLLKKHFCDIVNQNFPIEHGTVNTLLFGNKTGLEEERKNLYKTVGLSHFLVISGLHISVAGGGIYMFLRRLGVKRSPAAFFGILFVLFYGCLVGFSVSVMRAVIMYIIRLVADIMNRSYDILTALAIAALVTLCSNPLWIRDSAFLYSYTAVLFVGLYMTFMRRHFEAKYYSKLNDKHNIQYYFAKIKMTAAPLVILYLGLLPLNLYFQSYSNLLSVPLNLLLGVLTTPILFTGAAGFLCSLMKLSVLAGICDFICAVLLRIIDFMSTYFSDISITKLIYKPSLFAIIIYYCVFLAILFILPNILSFLEKCIVMSTIVWFISTNLNPNMYVTVLDVEQGDCLVVRTGTHSAIISDCGSTGRLGIAENVVVPYLLSQGFTTIEDIYVSHGDSDHTNGIEWLLENKKDSHITIKRIVFPRLNEELWNDNLYSIKSTADRHGTKTVSISAGSVIYYGDFEIHCLSPSADKLSGDSNTDSLVLWLKYGEFDALLTGDATFDTEEKLVLPANISFEMLKVAHHGSRFSTSESFLEELSPTVSTISVGVSNNYGHPHPDTLSRLRSANTLVLRTDECGAITITPGKSGFGVDRFIDK